MAGATTIRRLARAEQELLVQWAAQEGWNPGLHDSELFWQLDDEGFLGIMLDSELAGGGAIIKHGPRFGFMGLFIMRPEYRSRKLGTQLWYARRDALLDRLEPGATIGLDAVDAMVPFYARGGFVPQTRQSRFEWQVPRQGLEAAGDIPKLDAVDFEQLLQFDRSCFPVTRDKYLRMWIQQPDSHAFGLVQADQIQGYGVMRRCMSGWKIGPLFAVSPIAARRLLLAFGQRAAGSLLYLDVPENSPAAQQLCHSFGMREVFGCVRMYLGAAPDLATERIYSITTFEVG